MFRVFAITALLAITLALTGVAQAAPQKPLKGDDEVWQEGTPQPVPVAPEISETPPALPEGQSDICEYDQRHRMLLTAEVRSRLPDTCIDALSGDYPTRAAAWLAAVDKVLKTQRAEVVTPDARRAADVDVLGYPRQPELPWVIVAGDNTEFGTHYSSRSACEAERSVFVDGNTPRPQEIVCRNLTPPVPQATVVRPKQAPGFGTLFGYVPNDGRAAPVNELLNNIRGAIFCTLVLPGFCRWNPT